MQTKSQVPGGISDRSEWAENYGPKQGTCFLFSKQHLYHPVGTRRGGCELCSLCHKGAETAFKPLFWGRPFFLEHLRRQEASSAPPGPQRSGLRAIQEVLPVLGGELPQQPWLAGTKCDKSQWPERGPFPKRVHVACHPRSTQGGLCSRHFGGGSHPPRMLAHLPGVGFQEQSHRFDNSTS